MNKGRRFDSNGKLNKKKVAAVVIAFAVIVMFIIGLTKLLSAKIFRCYDKNTHIMDIRVFWATVGAGIIIGVKVSKIVVPLLIDIIKYYTHLQFLIFKLPKVSYLIWLIVS